MTRKKSINSQINRAKEILPKIEDEYNKSLHSKIIGEELKLDIQSFCSHLRSALDYLAKEIVETHCPKAKPKEKLYFPITSNSGSFRAIMKKSFPELDVNCKNIYAFLESIQPFQNETNKWLTHFNQVNNENKHNNFVEQTRIEQKRVSVDIRGGGNVSWNPSSVTFGRGVSIGGVPVNPNTQMPQPSSTQTVSVTTWVDFKFDGINVSALALMKTSLEKIENINSEISKEI